jgi:hypothetical protein
MLDFAGFMAGINRTPLGQLSSFQAKVFEQKFRVIVLSKFREVFESSFPVEAYEQDWSNNLQSDIKLFVC